MRSRIVRRIGALAVAAMLFVAVFAFVRWWDFALPSVGAARYQAVFLSNGQTYFGHLVERIGPYVKIEDAYYIQQTQPGDDQAQKAPESRLIRRGNELHRPLPFVLIPRTAILFVEDLRADSAVAQFMIKDSGK